MESNDPLKISKHYADNAMYFKDLLEASRSHIRPEYATKFEAIILACERAAHAYGAVATAPTPSAWLHANNAATDVVRARAAFAAVIYL
jgi:hypothetical protein